MMHMYLPYHTERTRQKNKKNPLSGHEWTESEFTGRWEVHGGPPASTVSIHRTEMGALREVASRKELGDALIRECPEHYRWRLPNGEKETI